MSPRKIWDLTWYEYEVKVRKYEYKIQKALVGPRMIATQIRNAISDKDNQIKERDYLYLPLLDDESKSSKEVEREKNLAAWDRLMGNK